MSSAEGSYDKWKFNNLKSLRKAAGLTQKVLASEAEISVLTLRVLEKGGTSHKFNVQRVKDRLSVYFCKGDVFVDLDEFIEREDFSDFTAKIAELKRRLPGEVTRGVQVSLNDFESYTGEINEVVEQETESSGHNLGIVDVEPTPTGQNDILVQILGEIETEEPEVKTSRDNQVRNQVTAAAIGGLVGVMYGEIGSFIALLKKEVNESYTALEDILSPDRLFADFRLQMGGASAATGAGYRIKNLRSLLRRRSIDWNKTFESDLIRHRKPFLQERLDQLSAEERQMFEMDFKDNILSELSKVHGKVLDQESAMQVLSFVNGFLTARSKLRLEQVFSRIE